MQHELSGDAVSHFDRTPTCGGGTNGQTPGYSTYRAIKTSRGKKKNSKKPMTYIFEHTYDQPACSQSPCRYICMSSLSVRCWWSVLCTSALPCCRVGQLAAQRFHRLLLPRHSDIARDWRQTPSLDTRIDMSCINLIVRVSVCRSAFCRIFEQHEAPVLHRVN